MYRFRQSVENKVGFHSQSKRTLENLGASDAKISAEELKEIHEILVNHEVKGDRYFGDDKAAMLWG